MVKILQPIALYTCLLAILSACAGTDADLEKAKFLLGKGGRERALEALEILTPLVATGALAGDQKYEAIRLYVGANLQAAGFDSIDILTTLLYSDDSGVLGTMRVSGRTVVDNARDYIANAENILSTNESEFGTLDERTRNGLYFQWALTELFDGLRIFLKVSTLSSTTFSLADCIANFTNAGTGNSYPEGIQAFQQSRGHLVDTTQSAKLSTANDVVKKLDQVIADLQANAASVNQICNYLEQQSQTTNNANSVTP